MAPPVAVQGGKFCTDVDRLPDTSCEPLFITGQDFDVVDVNTVGRVFSVDVLGNFGRGGTRASMFEGPFFQRSLSFPYVNMVAWFILITFTRYLVHHPASI